MDKKKKTEIEKAEVESLRFEIVELDDMALDMVVGGLAANTNACGGGNCGCKAAQ
jgi:hypothetical protein